MIEQIIIDICQQMGDTLNEKQMNRLKNVLFINFHGKTIEREKNEVIVDERDKDLEKMQLFVASKKVSGRKDNTLRQYINELQACKSAINKSFDDITTMDLRWYFGMLQEKRKNKISTIRNKIRYLNSFFGFLTKEELIQRNPVDKIEPPKMEIVIKKAFSSEDMEAIRSACKDVRERAMVEFLYSTGLRVSEFCSLNIGDVDIHKKEFVVMGKGSKERTIYLSDSASFHLKKYLKWREKREGESKENLESNPLFCAEKTHKRITKSGIEYIIKQLGEKAKVKNAHPHRFRRTFATDWLKRGMPLQEVAKIMGHKKVETTMIYCDISQDTVKSSYYRCA